MQLFSIDRELYQIYNKIHIKAMKGRSNRNMPPRDSAVGVSRKAESAKYTLELQAEISVG